MDRDDVSVASPSCRPKGGRSSFMAPTSTPTPRAGASVLGSARPRLPVRPGRCSRRLAEPLAASLEHAFKPHARRHAERGMVPGHQGSRMGALTQRQRPRSLHLVDLETWPWTQTRRHRTSRRRAPPPTTESSRPTPSDLVVLSASTGSPAVVTFQVAASAASSPPVRADAADLALLS